MYEALDAEFRFTLDPCPLDSSAVAGAPLWGKDGLGLDWRCHRVFCNPPYSSIDPWIRKAPEAEVAVYLLPAYTDRAWWHEHAMRATEIRFVRGRLRFSGASGGLPFPSVIVIFAHREIDPSTRWVSWDRPPR